MENSDLTESLIPGLGFLPTDFNEEYDHYDENEDDYDFIEDDDYDDGIAESRLDDGWEDTYEDENDEFFPETGYNPDEEDMDDSLQESEDYDAFDD